MNADLSAETVTLPLVFDDRNDEALVAAAKAGDHPAFSELWKRHSTRTLGTIYRITGNMQDAEDMLQESFLKAFLHLGTFDGRSTFSTWLTRIAINSAFMLLRKRRVRSETSIDRSVDQETWEPWEMEDTRTDIEAFSIQRETEQYLHQAIQELPLSFRDLVEFRYFGENSVNETAEMAQLSIPATKSRLRRARGVLRQSLRMLQ